MAALVGINRLNFDLLFFFSFWFCSEELERARWGWDDINMAVSTQLGLLLWKNFTYRRRQTVSTVDDMVSIWSSRCERHRGRETQVANAAHGKMMSFWKWCRSFKMMSFWTKEKASHFTNYRESAEDVTTAHFYPSTLWFMPTQHYVDQIWFPSGSTGASLSAKSLVCEQLSRLIIKLEPLLKVTAKAFQQLGQLFTTTAYGWFTQTATLVFIFSLHVRQAG